MCNIPDITSFPSGLQGSDRITLLSSGSASNGLGAGTLPNGWPRTSNEIDR